MAITNKKSDAGVLWVESLISGRTMEPLVEIHWGDAKAQMSVDEARQHALAVLECAEAAVSDAFVFAWLTRDIIGTDEDAKGNWDEVISEFKKFRATRPRSRVLGEDGS
jgi:hypothetical protein